MKVSSTTPSNTSPAFPYQIAYIPIGVPTFHLESAQAEFEKSIAALSGLTKGITKGLTYDLAIPGKPLLTVGDLSAFLDGIDPDLIILQNLTFANAAYATEVLSRFGCPLLLWTLREPVIDGDRLRLNSLTGAYSAANAMHAFGRKRFGYVFGSPEEEDVLKTLNAYIRAGEVRVRLRGSKIAAVGHTPQGFGFGRALDAEMKSVFGVTLEAVEARELMEKAQGYTDEECEGYFQASDDAMKGLRGTPEKNLKAYARLYKAYASYAEENKIAALATRCWPDFFAAYGTPVCAVLAMLNDGGVPSSCESDAYGALSMAVGYWLTGSAAFFGDPVSLDEGENTITFWHCGTAACSLARRDTGAAVGVHPNRKIGPTMEFGCKPCKWVVVFRFGRKPDGGFRLFIAEGEAIDKPKQFCGTTLVVKTKSLSKGIVEQSVKDGWEPHFVVAYGGIKEELIALADMLNIEVCAY